MHWKDEGFVIAIRKHSDNSIIASIFSKNYGHRKGLLRQNNKNYRLQIGDYVSAIWKSRSLTNLGYFKCESIKSKLYYHVSDSLKAITLTMITSILEKTLPENDPQTELYTIFLNFIESLEERYQIWQKKYIYLELYLLKLLGFGLDLSKCAISHMEDDLIFISPKTGQAISKNIGMKYKEKLLPLPKLLHDSYHNNHKGIYSNQEFNTSIRVLGYFLTKNLLPNTESKKIILRYRDMLLSNLV